jgi:hypothetical protein
MAPEGVLQEVPHITTERIGAQELGAVTDIGAFRWQQATLS